MDGQGPGGGHVPIDAGAHGARVLRGVLVSHKPRTDHSVSSLWGGLRLRATHARRVSGVVCGAQRTHCEGGGDLSLPIMVARIAGGEDEWKAAVSFCEALMLQKETAERIRRKEAAATAAAAAAAAVAAPSSGNEEWSGEDDQSPPPSPFRMRLRPRRVGRGTHSPTAGR